MDRVKGTVVLGMPFLGVGVFMGWLMLSQPIAPVSARNAEPQTRPCASGREVFVVTAACPDGAWHPLAEATRSPLVEFVPAALTPGPVVHVNADGTAIVTDNAQASRRSAWERSGKHGYPRPSSSSVGESAR